MMLHYNNECSEEATIYIIGGNIMTTNNKIYLTAAELAEMLGISRGHSYKLIQKMNAELSAKGYIVVAGKVPVKYFEERYFGFSA